MIGGSGYGVQVGRYFQYGVLPLHPTEIPPRAFAKGLLIVPGTGMIGYAGPSHDIAQVEGTSVGGKGIFAAVDMHSEGVLTGTRFQSLL